MVTRQKQKWQVTAFGRGQAEVSAHRQDAHNEHLDVEWPRIHSTPWWPGSMRWKALEERSSNKQRVSPLPAWSVLTIRPTRRLLDFRPLRAVQARHPGTTGRCVGP